MATADETQTMSPDRAWRKTFDGLIWAAVVLLMLLIAIGTGRSMVRTYETCQQYPTAPVCSPSGDGDSEG